MDWGWIADRVALVSLDRILDNMRRGRDDVSWGPNRQFRFPVRGGTGAVWRALGERLSRAHGGSVLPAHRLASLDTTRHLAHFENGRSIHYERLLSTAPLDDLVKMSDGCEYLRAAVDGLHRTAVHVLGVALHGAPTETIAHRCWMYFPQTDCPFHRVTTFSRYSPFNVPDQSRYWSLLVEVSEPSAPSDGAADGSPAEAVLDALVRNRLIASRDQVHHVWHARLEHGYPVPTLQREASLRVILPALEAVDVYSRGRFGAWRYEVSNQDHSFAQGVELVDRWLTGSAERTLNHPEIINTGG
jgi:protoporphyrinogen oxidase